MNHAVMVGEPMETEDGNTAFVWVFHAKESAYKAIELAEQFDVDATYFETGHEFEDSDVESLAALTRHLSLITVTPPIFGSH